ncbi:phosphate ABC transporter permease subunit PstC [Methanolobus zinderi]|uniref:Phosphate ABC transporter permease subunit PstC n=1 Tax=Methanolobus zinderi TaxID=536044 RepID=A0A7D5INW6_9EURY|nr:phosphate ABC transporter permease subunit PstC [Methanolobus zinderi]QLC49394.1 phosphate ABC transporter permease subunit PstC [Methanolobus zinderi]QLC49507.1 phosphate ABC transporter permease subunit PstC [Methanolobus zinderi]
MNIRRLKDSISSRMMLAMTAFACLLFFFMLTSLYYRASPILSTVPIYDLLFSKEWSPYSGKFGFFPFILGTLWVTVLALAIAVPVSLLSSIYLSEYADKGLRTAVNPLIDLLAGIPSVVYGLWGVLAVVPFIKNTLAPALDVETVGGYSVLAGGIVLSIMVFPIIISVTNEVIRSVPQDLREVSLSVGATKWQTIKYVVLRKAKPGIFAAIVLGFSRAFGETMAVLMVVGNVSRVPSSIFDPAYPLPALIANTFGEMMSVPLYDSAILLAALMLFIVVLVFNIFARMVLIKIEKGVI